MERAGSHSSLSSLCGTIDAYKRKISYDPKKRKRQGSNLQELTPRPLSKRMPSPTVGLRFPTESERVELSRAFASPWFEHGAFANYRLAIPHKRMGWGSNPQGRLSLVSLAGRCRRQLSASPSVWCEWDLNPRKTLLSAPFGFQDRCLKPLSHRTQSRKWESNPKAIRFAGEPTRQRSKASPTVGHNHRYRCVRMAYPFSLALFPEVVIYTGPRVLSSMSLNSSLTDRLFSLLRARFHFFLSRRSFLSCCPPSFLHS